MYAHPIHHEHSQITENSKQNAHPTKSKYIVSLQQKACNKQTNRIRPIYFHATTSSLLSNVSYGFLYRFK